jgi:hypothetical protein
MRRKKLLAALAVLAVVLAAGAFVLWPPPERVTWENFERISVGMSRADVVAILDGPPGDYTTGPDANWGSYVHPDKSWGT